MIKVYFDWNVVSQMKNGDHNDLRGIVFENEKLFIPFSTSHIGDILSSFKETETQRNYIESDLLYISKLTKDKCLMNNGKDIILDYYPPKELFEKRVEEKDTFNDMSLSGLMSVFEQDDVTKGIGIALVNLLKSIPIDTAFQEAIKNPQSAEQLNNIFPGLIENPTMEGFFNSFNQMNLNLNESDGYQRLREMIQKGMGINRDKIFNSNDPYKIIDNKYTQIGSCANQYIDKTKNAPEWFNNITNEYLLLDMHGYQEDRVNIKKGRKETFKNTTEDSFHAAFASTCSFYVLNDNKSYKKTKLIYKKLGINTMVLKPKEFVEYYQKFLDIKDISLNITLPLDILRTEEFHEEVMEAATLRTYYVPFFFFNFFNKIMVLTPNDNSETIVLLGQNVPTNHKVYSMEVIDLYKQLSEILGNDIDNLGKIKEQEFSNEKWIGRKWESDRIIYRLTRTNGHIQLYFDQK